APLSAERISSAAGYFGLITGIATVAGLSACAGVRASLSLSGEGKAGGFRSALFTRRWTLTFIGSQVGSRGKPVGIEPGQCAWRTSPALHAKFITHYNRGDAGVVNPG